MNSLRKKINPLVPLLVLPVFALAAAADDPHPLHGIWFAEEDGSELELALHRDGTFRMTVTTSEGLSSDEDEFDEDEFDEDESWEDILADLDSNDNGVIDEEEYQAAQADGDEDLDESWDEVLEADINADGAIDEEEYNSWEDEFDEDEFDEDEFDEDESWEDILADLDSNDNGVIDEEEYQAAQADGDEDLDESWDEVLEADINADGAIDEEEYNSWVEIVEDEDWEGVDLFVIIMMAIFLEEDIFEEIFMTMVVTGTWEAQDDQFTLEAVETVITINDMTIVEFYTEIFNEVIDGIFEESGLSEDEFIATISEDDDTITAETLGELKSAMVDELLTDMDEVAAPLFETEIFEYAINEDEMFATDSSGDPLSFVRLDAQSAVEAISWGQIKAMSR